MRKNFLLITLSLLMLMLCPFSEVRAAVGEGVKIDEINFPDTIFRTDIANADKDKNGYLSKEENQSITEVYYDGGDYAGYQKVKNLKGIEFLSNLENLHLNSTGVTSVDLSKNSHLNKIYIANQIMQELKLPENGKLSTLETFNSQLPSLDFRGQSELKQVSLSLRGETVDFSKNYKLESVRLNGTVREGSIISKGKKYISDVKKVVIGHNQNLKLLKCDLPKLQSLSIGKVPALKSVFVSGSKKIKSLYTEKMPMLRQLELENCGLTTLNLTKNKRLEMLICSKNKLKKLNLTKNKSLKKLFCDHNKLKKLNLKNNVKLTTLQCSSNELKTLNLKMNKNLKNLSCKRNKIDKLNIQKTKLKKKKITCDKKVIIVK